MEVLVINAIWVNRIAWVVIFLLTPGAIIFAVIEIFRTAKKMEKDRKKRRIK